MSAVREVIDAVLRDRLTMCSPDRLFALAEACRKVQVENIPGAFVATGVWRGGGALIAAEAFRGSGRALHLYDTFEGMTAPGQRDGAYAAAFYAEKRARGEGWCFATMEEVRNAFERFNLDREPVVFIKGDVVQMMPSTRPDPVAVAYLDTDFYESTRVAIEQLWPVLSPGGVMFFDDYGTWPGCRAAVDEYFANRVKLRRVSHACRYVVKP